MVRNFPTLSRENSSNKIKLQRVSQDMQPNRLGTVKAWEDRSSNDFLDDQSTI